MSERVRSEKQTMEYLTFGILFMALTVSCQSQENLTEIIQFPYDPENSKTFASIPITPTEEHLESFKLCLSFTQQSLSPPQKQKKY